MVAAVQRLGGTEMSVGANISRLWRSLAFGNPLYAMTLGGEQPMALSFVPRDPWNGDAENGRMMIAGIYRFAGQSLQMETPGWSHPDMGEAWHRDLHSFYWLRDLRAVGGDAARRQARRLVESWIDHHPRWQEQAWQPDILGQRLAHWLAFHDFFWDSASEEFRARTFESLTRQAKHLARVLPGGLMGYSLLTALKGLLFVGICLPGHEKWAETALGQIENQLKLQIFPDGGHIERSPIVQMNLLRDLIDIRALLAQTDRDMPDILLQSIDRVTPVLRFFLHADGGLSLFNGSTEGDRVTIHQALVNADAKGKTLKRLPHTGYERLQMGRTLLVMDCGTPPPQGYDRRSHAGLLSFEMSIGRERLIVNCGAHRSGEWANVLRDAAAHSTLTLDGMGPADPVMGGGLAKKPRNAPSKRDEADSALLIKASHDGFIDKTGHQHQRRLFLSAGGDDLRGEDNITGPEGSAFALRFHLHPGVTAMPIRSGREILLRLPSGHGWRFKASMTVGDGRISLEDSVYFGTGTTTGNGRRCQQIVLTGTTSDGNTLVKWGLKRESK